MNAFFHHPDEPRRQVCEGQPCPEGWTGPHTEAESEAWVSDWAAKYTPPAEVPRVYSREDYKAALDAMLLAQSKRREYDDITAAASRASRPGPFYPEGCWYFDLRDFTWCTSGVMAAQAPSENPPTPEDFAQYILALFIAQNGDIPARE